MAIKLPSFEFYHRLSRREQVLLLIVGGAVLLAANLIALSVALRATRELGLQLTAKKQQVRTAQLFAQEQPLWAKRADWLKAHQPPLANRDRAGTELLSFVQGAARVAGVVVTNPAIKPLAATPGGGAAKPSGEYQAVSVAFEAQGDWGALVHFLRDVQKPEAFVVFDDATLTTDPSDAARMRSRFTLSKWYAVR